MKIFCVGIGGIGLSGVAQILKGQGHEVSGSDNSPSEITEALLKNEIKVFDKHDKKNIDKNFDLIIYSEAVPEDNPERVEAQRLRVRQISYAEALGMISEDKKTIAIAGTHGKTTVTGMLTSIFLEADLDPSIIIGSKIDILDNQNYRVGASKLFLAEACEYRGNFLELSPDIVLINNLEPDHLDYFENADNYFRAFQTLIEKIPEDGLLILFESDQDKIDITKIKAGVRIISEDTGKNEMFNLKIPGKHNQRNAYAANAVAQALDISAEFIKKGLEEFNGTWRRFEYKGEINGAKIYDDYGHHPTEIEVTIEAARQWHYDKNLIVIFQPHQYSRTREFFDQFCKCFEGANEAWITDIYKARDSEEDIKSVSAEKLVQAIDQNARYIPIAQIPEQIKNIADSNTVFLVMGAGNIHDVFQKLELKK